MTRSRHRSKCGRTCWVCNPDKLKGHGGDWMKPSDRRRAQTDLTPDELDQGLRRYDEWAAIDGSGGAHLHADGYVVFLDSNGVPSVFMNAEDYVALRNNLDKE